MARVLLSRAAAEDLAAVDDHTLQAFGLQQAARLRQQFQEVFTTLAHAPLAAPRRPEYDPAGKSFRYLPVLRRFVVVYEAAQQEVRVVRVLHGTRDLAAELARESGEDR
jgi:plasmid stabilization system protein ParE